MTLIWWHGTRFRQFIRVSERTEAVQWQSHNDWDYAGGNIQNANIDEAVWDEFWNQVDNGEFINT